MGVWQRRVRALTLERALHQVKQLTDEDALSKIVRRNQELEWLLEQTMARNEGIDAERRVFIAGLEAALARSGQQMRDLIVQVASWKGAHASSVQMLEESCSAFAAYSDKLGKEKDEAVAEAQARLRQMQAVQVTCSYDGLFPVLLGPPPYWPRPVCVCVCV